MKSETSASKLWQRILLSHNMQISDTRTSICYICACVSIVSAEMKAKPKAIADTLFSLIAFRILLKRKRRKQSERERVKCVNKNQSVIYGKGQIMRRVFVYLYYCNPC